MNSRLQLVAGLASALLAACASHPHRSPPPQSPLCDAPAGDRSQLTTPAGQRDLYGFGVTIAEPEICATSAYIEIRGDGPRRLFLGRAPADPGVCDGRPAAADPCTLVSAHELGLEVFWRMEEAGLDANGVGMGACGKLGELPDWNFGVGVTNWAHADAAIEIVQDRLRAWRVGDAFGVSVTPIACGVLLEAGDD